MRKAGKDLSSYLWTTVSSWLKDDHSESKKIEPGGDGPSEAQQTVPNLASGPHEEMPDADDEPMGTDPIDKRYTPIRLLGQGGFGRVFLARDDFQDGQEVALKVIHRHHCGTREIEQRFRREIRILRNIAHESVPQIYNDGKTETGELYFTMRFVPGRSLLDLIDAEAPLEESRAIRLAIQIAQALAHSHSRGLVHRDLKPSNIQITTMENGEEGVALLDFGIASVLSGPQATGATLTGSLVGTPVYMAPERMHGRSATAAVDQYALGLVLYQMLSGEEPFTASKLREAGPRHAKLGSTPGVAQLVRELIAPNPEERPTAAATVERLNKILATPAERRSRTKWLVIGGFAIVMTISALTTIFLRSDKPEIDPPVVSTGTDKSLVIPPPVPPDTEKPRIANYDDIIEVCGRGQSGAMVKYRVTATDNDGRPPKLVFDHDPGFFSIGDHKVICTATDSIGNHEEATFRVTVQDKEKPQIDPIPAITEICGLGQRGALVKAFEVNARDNDGKPPKLDFDHELGFFPIGEKQPVTCTATDSSSNHAEAKFFVTVQDKENPRFDPIAVIAMICEPGKSGALVEAFEVTATDNDGKPPRLEFDHELGFFPIGENQPVTCTATDASGNHEQARFFVTVTDTEKPIIAPIAAITKKCNRGEKVALVKTFPVTAKDNDGKPPRLVFDHQPGTFQIGDKLVTCTATDSSGNTQQAVFNVSILPPDSNPEPPGPTPSGPGARPDPADPSRLLLRHLGGVETGWHAEKVGRTAIEFVSCDSSPGTIIVVVRSKLSDGNLITSTMALVSDVFRPLPSDSTKPFLVDVHEMDAQRASTLGAFVSGAPRTNKPTAGPSNNVAMGVSFDEAAQIASRLGKRLPSPIEWHTAARWGDGTWQKHPWGAELDINKVTFLDEWPLHQRIDASIQDVSAFGVRACFSGAREWARGSEAGDASGCLMGPYLVGLLKIGNVSFSNHGEAYKAWPDIYWQCFELAAQSANGDPATEFDDASVRCIVRLVSEH